MKLTKDLVITLKERYFTQEEALEESYILLKEKNIKTKIKIAGKNKYFLKFENVKFTDGIYKDLKQELKEQNVEIYKESKKHKSRLYKMNKNKTRQEEEEEINIKFNKIC